MLARHLATDGAFGGVPDWVRYVHIGEMYSVAPHTVVTWPEWFVRRSTALREARNRADKQMRGGSEDAES